MTILWGDTGRASVGPLKTFTMSTPYARDSGLLSPVTLPTTEPATAQVSWIVTTDDLCTITPSVPMKHFGVVMCSGKTPTGATVNYRVLKNGVSQASGSGPATPANNFWNHTYYNLGEVQVGDVLEVKLWSTQIDSYMDFNALWLSPSQPEVSKRGTILKDLNWNGITNPSGSNTFKPETISALGNLNLSNTAGMLWYPLPLSAVSYTVATNTSAPIVIPWVNYGLWRTNQGDALLNVYVQNHSLNRNFQRFSYPSSFSFREIAL